MTVRLRNVEADLKRPVDQWPYEALVTVIERGLVYDWLPVVRAIDDDPWGPVARQVEDYLGYARPYGVGALFERMIARARASAAEQERAAVAAAVRRLVQASGLSNAEFAASGPRAPGCPPTATAR